MGAMHCHQLLAMQYAPYPSKKIIAETLKMFIKGPGGRPRGCTMCNDVIRNQTFVAESTGKELTPRPECSHDRWPWAPFDR